ncbi:hypothetical protein [Aestuariibacter sp. GS-14]|uniref:hypothetical protein n=1 Tax=Aestuariibacter sp. GS-14 TaxID=2590670 RepID=UPI0015E83271|nr:hypothetical protein [Aestuariibacter sp. GS-14]
MQQKSSPSQRQTRTTKKRWWSTDCQVCIRMRLYVIWTVIMMVVYFYVFDQ